MPVLVGSRTPLVIREREHPRARALFQRMTTPPSARLRGALDGMCKALDRAGLTAKIGALQFYAMETEQQALLPIIGAATPTNSGGATFTPGRGFQGNGSSSCIITGYAPAADPLASQLAAMLGVWSNVATSGTTSIHGATSAAGGSWEACIGINSAANAYADINLPRWASAATVAVTDKAGLLCVNRDSDTTVSAYHRGIAKASVASASMALSTVPIALGAVNSSDGPYLWNAQPIGAFVAGASLTASEHAALSAILETAMRAVGNWRSPIVGWGDSLTAGPNTTPWLTQLAALTTPERPFQNGGVSGQTSAQILSRCQAGPAMPTDIAVIWAGRNDPGALISQASTLANIAAMIATLPHSRYLVLSVPNGDASSEYAGGASYNAILSLNAALAAAWPRAYVDMRSILVAAYNPSIAQDVIDHGRDVPPSSLRLSGDFLHYNAAGHAVIAAEIDRQIAARGWD